MWEFPTTSWCFVLILYFSPRGSSIWELNHRKVCCCLAHPELEKRCVRGRLLTELMPASSGSSGQSSYRNMSERSVVILDMCSAVSPFTILNQGLVRKKGNVLFNDALNTFYLRLYGVRHMVKDHSDSERGNPLPTHRLLFLISSKGSFICPIPQTG